MASVTRKQEHGTKPFRGVWGVGVGAGRIGPGEVGMLRKRKRRLKMAPPAFKACLAHAHRGMTCHLQMMELQHACRGSHSCVICR